jgi:hypothetical protein
MFEENPKKISKNWKEEENFESEETFFQKYKKPRAKRNVPLSEVNINGFQSFNHNLFLFNPIVLYEMQKTIK